MLSKARKALGRPLAWGNVLLLVIFCLQPTARLVLVFSIK